MSRSGAMSPPRSCHIAGDLLPHDGRLLQEVGAEDVLHRAQLFFVG